MDPFTLLSLIVSIGYLGFTMYQANQEQLAGENKGIAHKLLYIAPALTFLMGLTIVLAAMTSAAIKAMPPDEQADYEDVPDISAGLAVLGVTVAWSMSAVMLQVVRSIELRQSIQRRLAKYGSYDAESIVHTTAIVFILFLIVVSVTLVIQAHGLENEPYAMDEFIFQNALEVVAAFLGIGYAIRRAMPATLERLGLRVPTRNDVLWGLGTGFALIMLLLVFSGIIEAVSPDNSNDTEPQDLEGIYGLLDTIPLALIGALMIAVGEEVFFRGALQPIFGVLPTSIFFTLTHTDRIFDPAIVIILFAAICFGRLRQRHSTTAAIIAHFLYDFTIFVMVIAASSGNGA